METYKIDTKELMQKVNDWYANCDKPALRDSKGNRLDSDGNIITEEELILS